MLVYVQQGLAVVSEGSEKLEVNENWTLPDDAKALYDETGKLAGYRRGDQDFLFVNTIGNELMARRMLEAPPQATHEVHDDYDYFLRLYEEERHWRQSVPQVIHHSDRKWQDTRNGRIMWYLHPGHDPLSNGLRMFEVYLQELPPGGRSGKHSHVGEELHFIIEGSGYDEIEGTRWDWEANDVVAVPVLSTHQSFNSDPDRPARFVVFKSRLYDYLSFGGIEHLEDASG